MVRTRETYCLPATHEPPILTNASGIVSILWLPILQAQGTDCPLLNEGFISPTVTDEYPFPGAGVDQAVMQPGISKNQSDSTEDARLVNRRSWVNAVGWAFNIDPLYAILYKAPSSSDELLNQAIETVFCNAAFLLIAAHQHVTARAKPGCRNGPRVGVDSCDSQSVTVKCTSFTP